jgi:hypothetical protein
MNAVALLGSTLGLGFVAGIRLYATVLALGIAIRFNWIQLTPDFAGLRIIAQPAVIALAGIGCAAEFFSDKIPWVDSVWDSFHTLIRPVGAAVLAATAIGNVDPTIKLLLVLACGGVALTSHSSKAATRLLVNHSPEPFTNVGLSLAGDAIAPVGAWLSMTHPSLMLTFVALFLAAFTWLSPRVFRLIRLQLIALRMLLKRTPGRRLSASGFVLPSGIKSDIATCVSIVARNSVHLPSEYAERLKEIKAPTGVRCAATRKMKGLRNSIGYLAIGPEDLIFVTRRLFRWRTLRVPTEQILNMEIRRGLLLHRLIINTFMGENSFNLFRDFDMADVPGKQGSDTRAANAR